MSGQRRTPHFRHSPLAVFGRRLRAVRTARGMSQMDLAFAADRHFTFVSGIERGLRNVTLTTIHQLAEALDVNPALFIDRDEQAAARTIDSLKPIERRPRRGHAK